ncbi:hypothetical protein BDZ97DRAFT_1827856, partial [Flammula alnicola]
MVRLATSRGSRDLFGREFVNDIENAAPSDLDSSCHKGIKAAVKLGKGAHKAHEATQNNNNNNNHHHRREFEEEDFDLRELGEDIEEREPFGLGLLLSLGKGAHKAHEATNNNNNNNNHHHRREFDDEEIDLRELATTSRSAISTTWKRCSS